MSSMRSREGTGGFLQYWLHPDTRVISVIKGNTHGLKVFCLFFQSLWPDHLLFSLESTATRTLSLSLRTGLELVG